MSTRQELASLPDDALLHRKEVATYLACRPELLEEWAVAGKGPPFIKDRRWVRYRLGDVRAWTNKHRRGRL